MALNGFLLTAWCMLKLETLPERPSAVGGRGLTFWDPLQHADKLGFFVHIRGPSRNYSALLGSTSLDQLLIRVAP